MQFRPRVQLELDTDCWLLCAGNQCNAASAHLLRQWGGRAARERHPRRHAVLVPAPYVPRERAERRAMLCGRALRHARLQVPDSHAASAVASAALRLHNPADSGSRR